MALYILLKATAYKTITVPQYTRSDGTIVPAHQKTVHYDPDKSVKDVINGNGTKRQKEAAEKLRKVPGFNQMPKQDQYAHILSLGHDIHYSKVNKAVRKSMLHREFKDQCDDVKERLSDTHEWMKAPNGKHTALSEEDWIVARTDGFKRWFGDWELSNQQFYVMSIVCDPGFKNTKEVKDWIKKHRIYGVMSDEQTNGKGRISISAGSLDEMLNRNQRRKTIESTMVDGAEQSKEEIKRNEELHFAVATKIREIIWAAKIVETKPDFTKVNGKRSPDNPINPEVAVKVMYCPINFMNKIHARIRLTMMTYKDKNTAPKSYAYSLDEIEVLTEPLENDNEIATFLHNRTPIHASSLLDGVKDVNDLDLICDHSTVLDNNGEPKKHCIDEYLKNYVKAA